MTLDEFATITQRIIARDGLEGFQPTACYPQRRHMAVLAGLPSNVNVEAEALAWASDKADPGEEMLVAFLVGGTTLKIIRQISGSREEGVFAAQ